ncbi:AbrB/MazE/SpoVT family DNA-binding domain-containing protein [Synechocystis sp. FACHB-383]|jgi:antitoxin MazE|uniref:AbrB/MazE/SpoVT family DNA-binding domain-containing protein n=1 Tax=unclassified Synechocystis TaxID=2640012 RepID=UPI00168315BA|nr:MULTISPECIES: AbrB/MazE/SpoVT family DNA-binding domain-containing protein [unclassified Synechocystis]MBD2652022.1 AbrB/MazE/SpoVT family DNA-binding domain-containing protein [Synechocystis sp. FACHB-383]MBE9194009.1 AbrB/MazE/SpoVT family DNA-binding domain-containing protein [Synechocystis sp. LEGE 06083]
MEVELRKWGNSLGLRIPHKLAVSWELNDQTVVDLVETEQGLMIQKKPSPPNLTSLLASIPPDFTYPDDVVDFVASAPQGQEVL